MVGCAPRIFWSVSELRTLSEATGCRILAKAEHLNPGGSVKDRAAARIILRAEQEGRLPVGGGGTIVEATGGNTGIAMALIGAARGHSVVVVMPDTISREKIELMRALGARVVTVAPVAFSDPKHYVHTAQRIAQATPGAVYGNQFESLENMRAHLFGTGPEIWRQTGGVVDGFVAAAGTGGTLCGVSHALKERRPAVRVYLIDPPGSSLAAFVEDGELRASPGPTVTEGIGIGRLTSNFAAARVDGAFQGSDEEALAMKLYLTRYEGINVGPSAALNVVGAVKLARVLGPDSTIVTILCDSGERYSSATWAETLATDTSPGSPASLLQGPGNVDFVRA